MSSEPKRETSQLLGGSDSTVMLRGGKWERWAGSLELLLSNALLTPAVVACYFKNTTKIPFQQIKMENQMTAGRLERRLAFKGCSFLSSVLSPLTIHDKRKKKRTCCDCLNRLRAFLTACLFSPRRHRRVLLRPRLRPLLRQLRRQLPVSLSQGPRPVRPGALRGWASLVSSAANPPSGARVFARKVTQ